MNSTIGRKLPDRLGMRLGWKLSRTLKPVWPDYGIRGWLHERFRGRFHVRFAANRRCDLLYLQIGVRQESLSIFFCTKSQMRFGVRFRVPHHIAQQIATRYCILRVNGCNSVSDTKSQMHRIASAICSKSDVKSHTKSLVPLIFKGMTTIALHTPTYLPYYMHALP
jgi:hypothetical protein